MKPSRAFFIKIYIPQGGSSHQQVKTRAPKMKLVVGQDPFRGVRFSPKGGNYKKLAPIKSFGTSMSINLFQNLYLKGPLGVISVKKRSVVGNIWTITQPRTLFISRGQIQQIVWHLDYTLFFPKSVVRSPPPSF